MLDYILYVSHTALSGLKHKEDLEGRSKNAVTIIVFLWFSTIFTVLTLLLISGKLVPYNKKIIELVLCSAAVVLYWFLRSFYKALYYDTIARLNDKLHYSAKRAAFILVVLFITPMAILSLIGIFLKRYLYS